MDCQKICSVSAGYKKWNSVLVGYEQINSAIMGFTKKSSLVLLYAEAKGNNSFMRAVRAVELRLPSGAINKAVLSPARIESPHRFRTTGACHLKTRRKNSLPLLMK